MRAVSQPKRIMPVLVLGSDKCFTAGRHHIALWAGTMPNAIII